MKKMALLLVALAATLLMLLAAGCGGSAVSPAINRGDLIATTDGDYLKIGIEALNSANQPTYDGQFNTWTANLTANGAVSLSFFPKLAGHKTKGGPGWDYEIKSTDAPFNWQDSTADLAAFTKNVATLLNGVENQIYTFRMEGRFLVRAYEPGTRKQTDMVFLNILSNPAPAEPDLRVVAQGGGVWDEATNTGYSLLDITITNYGGPATNATVQIAGNDWFPGQLAARVRYGEGLSVTSAATYMGEEWYYQTGQSTIMRLDSMGSIDDSIVVNGLWLDTIRSGEEIKIRCIYNLAPQLDPGKG